jgi:integration host factor subunit beta
MTKAELVNKISDKVPGITKKRADVIVDIFFGSIINALASKDKVEVRGFGSFHVRSRKERNGRNPKTGTHVTVPAKSVPFFKTGKELRELVDSKR